MSENGGKAEFLPGYETIDRFTQTNLRKILGVTKTSNGLPGEKREDYDYYSTFPGFRKTMLAQSKRLRDMLKSQLSFQGIKSSVPTSEVDDLVDLLTDANDTILERINIALDEASGVKKDVNPMLLAVSESNVSRVAGSWNNFDRTKKKNQTNEVKLLAAKNVLRPQVKFKKFIDNTSKPFMPRLTDKPHSRKPLSVLVEYDDSNQEYFSHPYLFEIQRFTPGDFMLEGGETRMSKTVETTDMTYVENSSQLEDMMTDLRCHRVIGVDLEGHTYRSYLGFTCLIQISTESKDYLVDPFNIWEDMTRLNEVFADPKIVKVMHGCQQDVAWLQRDFSVYLVNVFDTHQAGKVLGFPRLSLAWLLEHYCKIYADKQYQLADWRIRPLPDVMVYYARQDTRYLIYLYNKLKGELIEKGNDQKNLLMSVYQQSNLICTQRYNKPEVKADSHENLMKKTKSMLNNRQLTALQDLFLWRDTKGREEDESTQYVLPNHMLLKICAELPREMQGILACCNPIPPLVKQNLQEIHMIILKARNKVLQTVDTDLLTDTSAQADRTQSELDFNDNPLTCPLDLRSMDLGSGLPTLLDSRSGKFNKFVPKKSGLVKGSSDLAVFNKKTDKKRNKPEIKQFVSPFQRYRLLVPYLEKLKIIEQEPPEKMAKVETPASSTPDLHLQNIQKHFQKLTEMTPKPKKVEETEEMDEDNEDENDDAVEVVEEDEKPVPLRMKRNQKNEEIEKDIEKRKLEIENKLVQEEINKKKKKRKSTTGDTANDSPSKIPKKEFNYENEDSQEAKNNKKPEEFNYANVDFKSMFSAKAPAKSNDFDPYANKKDKKNFKNKKDNKNFQKKK